MDDTPCGRVLSRDAFVEELKAEVIINGYGVVPLIGSGISHGSGIMIGSALGEYLAFVIWRLIAGYDQSKSNTSHTFSMVDKGWPNPPTQRERKVVNEWATLHYCSLLERHRIGPDVLRSFDFNNLHQPFDAIYRLAPLKPLAFDRNTFERYAWKNPQNRMSEEWLDAINRTIRELQMYHLQFSRVFRGISG